MTSARSNPLHGNALENREDLERAVRDLFAPLVPYFSEGGARVRLGTTASKFGNDAAELEGFARSLWGLSPLAAGGGPFDHWELIRQGLVNGTDPEHREYWGDVRHRGQQIVESASLGFSLAVAPQHVWTPLTHDQQQNLGRWLERIMNLDTPANNWNFFPIMVAMGLDRVGWHVDWSRLEHHFEAIEHFYLSEGWYRDGYGRRLDHYVAFSFHFYGLLYSKLRNGDDIRRKMYIDRAVAFAQDYKYWFATDGSALPFGRSLTYRFAHASFWSALAFADVEALPWGEVKGLILANLRWWADQPIADRDGVLSVGYTYPNLMMSEEYISPGSPNWATKLFVLLCVSDDHPFWSAEETKPKPPRGAITLQNAGMIVFGEPRNTTALVTGQEHPGIRHGAEKYSKFAYSTRYAFSVESSDVGFSSGAFDSMLAFSDDGIHYRVRTTVSDARIADDTLYSEWKPWPDVEIETWLIAMPPWHLRIHRITTPRALESAEGGFATEHIESSIVDVVELEGVAAILTTEDFSGIRSPVDSASRAGVVMEPMPNTNLMFPRSLVPQLRGTIPAGRTFLASAVLASPDVATFTTVWTTPPHFPSDSDLDHRREQATVIGGWITKQGSPSPGPDVETPNSVNETSVAQIR